MFASTHSSLRQVSGVLRRSVSTLHKYQRRSIGESIGGLSIANRSIRRGCLATSSALLDGRDQPAALFGQHAFSTAAAGELSRLRNIGISAHIDSGKTTLTERVLFYTGRVDAIHDVRGKDGVGAKMDSMELEREKGITIQSAATYCAWGDHHINIIDTPGHVDFTVEVERALRVLDGAVLVLCSVSGVQSQSITVDRQMKRYDVPRVAFINKLDRMGADPDKVVSDLREKLQLNAAAVQVPIGLSEEHKGVVDIVENQAIYFDGDYGERMRTDEVPSDMQDSVNAKRQELIEILADIDEDVGEAYLMEEEPSVELLRSAIRKGTISLQFCPVFMGSAFKNKGVQPLLDGVVSYLPCPSEVRNFALDRADGEKEVEVTPDPDAALVALAFKLEESRFGQLTYLRVYQGTLARGKVITNVDRSQRMKTPRLVRMHADEMEDIDSVGPGEIVAMFGVDCHSGDTFTDGVDLAMTSMFVPEPVISYSIKPKTTQQQDQFAKALNRFTKEDPTFRTFVDRESGETIIQGMGELHLDIYVERMKREYKVDVITGKPQVNYRETISRRAEFNYLHKKQSGGAGQYARVEGYMEPLPDDAEETFDFQNAIIGNAIPPEYITATRKGFELAMQKGRQIGHPVQGVRVVITDGQAHVVDSSEMAFSTAAQYAFTQGFEAASPVIMEPIMHVEVQAPAEFHSTVIGGINKRKGQLLGSDVNERYVTLWADVPLSQMFGYSTDLRSSTQGKAEFSMEYARHAPVMRDVQERLVKEYQAARAAEK